MFYGVLFPFILTGSKKHWFNEKRVQIKVYICTLYNKELIYVVHFTY